MEIIMDACASMAVIIKNPERDLVIKLTQYAEMVSPNMLPYEISNALTKMMKMKIIEKDDMLNAFSYFKKMPIKSIDINFENAIEIAWAHKTYAYDACYLEEAKRLNLPLLTFDRNMAKVGTALGINILGGTDVGI
jgi:predicted nucleic acid-binding protein